MSCQIVALNPKLSPTFDVELFRESLIVSVLDGGSTYEFWRGNAREFDNPIPIPW
jgi:hypothetical protein